MNSHLRPCTHREPPSIVARAGGGLDPDVAIAGILEQRERFVLGVPGERERLILARGDRALVAAFVAALHVDASHLHVEERFRALADAATLYRRYLAHFDHRHAWRMLRAGRHEQVEQEQAG